MGSPKSIWTHEVAQASRIADSLVGTNRAPVGWRRVIFPLALADLIRRKRKIGETHKNLLYTKELAFNVAKEVAAGHDRALELGSVDAKTREVLRKEQKGFYTEKIRKRQLSEIALLVDHYTRLLNAEGKDYDAMVQNAYGTRKEFQTFLNRLERKEEEVIQAAISSMRKGSKKERVAWFKKLEEITRIVRTEDLERIFPES